MHVALSSNPRMLIDKSKKDKSMIVSEKYDGRGDER